MLRLRFLAKLFVLGAAVVASLGAKQDQPAMTSEATAGLLPEVRMRKLHLVRPDLIPYPISYEVIC